ncbi:MAG: hypothetical protein NZ529_00450 [Cytophagaceae bacterium]|nr:hypothetical protein [Cytophagaceae bacterium]MDW8455234.1 hypothetical protein [Cytophagaceae bacterium]
MKRVRQSHIEQKEFGVACARDGSHGLQGQCGALAEHRSDSGVADSPAPQGRAQQKKTSLHFWKYYLR